MAFFLGEALCPLFPDLIRILEVVGFSQGEKPREKFSEEDENQQQTPNNQV